MRIKSLLLALFVAGAIASAALADKPASPPGQANTTSNGGTNGNGGSNNGVPHQAVLTDTTSTETTVTTTTAANQGKSTSLHGNATSTAHTPNKVLVCKATGSVKHPYVLVRVAPKAAAKLLLNPRNVAPVDTVCPTTAAPKAVHGHAHAPTA
jgi:hypothetical protein